MQTPPTVLRFRARGPFVAQLFDVHDGHVTTEPWPTNLLWRLGGNAMRLIGVALFVHPALAVVAFAFLVVPAALAFVLGIVPALIEKRGRPIRADRSGIRIARDHVPWSEIAEVLADNVEWQLSTPRITHAIVLRMRDGTRQALLVPSFQAADVLAIQLDFMRRNSAGTEEDVPEALRDGLAAFEDA